MTQVLHSLLSQTQSEIKSEAKEETILCYYVNGTSEIQIVRIANIPNWYFEKIVFPKQRLLFEAPPNAQLEIHRHTHAGTTLADYISCNYLRVIESSRSSQNKIA